MIFVQCQSRGCRREDNLVACTGCGELVCPECVTQLPDQELCTSCSPARAPAPKGRAGQLELFA